ncbi:hypothetical protein M2105_005472 [Paenibacillus sp. PastF-1]|nr:hypothetical protein [Paenibacillus sp. PastF-1]MDF9857576.1 hypothetical protein [Paenibacillus sp. PastF-1]
MEQLLPWYYCSHIALTIEYQLIEEDRGIEHSITFIYLLWFYHN